MYWPSLSLSNFFFLSCCGMQFPIDFFKKNASFKSTNNSNRFNNSVGGGGGDPQKCKNFAQINLWQSFNAGSAALNEAGKLLKVYFCTQCTSLGMRMMCNMNKEGIGTWNYCDHYLLRKRLRTDDMKCYFHSFPLIDFPAKTCPTRQKGIQTRRCHCQSLSQITKSPR